MDFSTLDYANADLYEGINQRPPSATPLQIPLPDLGQIPEAAKHKMQLAARAREQNNEMYEAGRAQREAQAQREAALAAKEQARNLEMRQRYNPHADNQPKPATGYDYLYKEKPQGSPRTPNSTATLPIETSRASLPVTANNSSARPSAAVAPNVPPAGVGLQELIPPNNRPPTAPPRSTPQPAGIGGGLVAGGAIGAAARVATGVIVGENIGSAIAGGVGVGVGTVAGGVVGTFFGPVGTAIGSTVGGMIGGSIASALYNLAFPPPAQLPSQTVQGIVPFEGGQTSGTAYRVYVTFDLLKNSDGTRLSSDTDSTYADVYMNGYGPISSVTTASAKSGMSASQLESVPYNCEMSCMNAQGQPITVTTGLGYIDPPRHVGNLRNIRVERTGGNPESGGNPAPLPIPSDTRTPNSYYHPGNQEYAPPTATPVPKPAPNNYAPGGFTAGGTPRGDSPNWIPHAFLAPGINPNPTQTPSNLGGDLPSTAPAPAPAAINPGDQALAPSKSYADLGATPRPKWFGDNNAQPIPMGKTSVTLPSQLPKTSKSQPVADKNSPTPKAQNPDNPSPTATPTTDYQDLQKKIGDQGAALAIITGLIQQLPQTIPASDEFRENVRIPAARAVCETAQPGGCLDNALNNQASNINNNTNNRAGDILGAVNAAENTAQIAMLTDIQNRIGAQVPGGISGKLSRIGEWLHLDRVLNMMIWATTIHNALMLSNDIGQTLLATINNVFQLFGLKKEDGNPFDIGSVFSASIENIIKGMIGADNYTQLRETWAKANRVYQATANLFNSILNLSQTILQASELIAAYTGRIGNALKKGGVILENAYGWMNPQPKFNRITSFLEGLQNGASTIQMVTQAPLDVVNAVTESTTAATEFVKAVKEDDKPVNKAVPIPEPDELKAKETQSKTDSQPLDFDFSDLFDGED